MENKPMNNMPGNGGRKSRFFSSLLTLITIALMIGLLWSALKVDTSKTDDEYYQVIQYFDEGKVTEYNLNLGTRKLTYILKGEKEKRTYTVPSCDLFVADIHDDVREYNQEHEDAPIKMNYESGTSNYWISQMIPMVGMLLLMGIMLYWLVKKMSGTVMDDTRRTMAFGKARLKTGEEARKTTFEDVAGLDEEKEDLEEIVEFLKNPQKFNDLGARIPKGVLLVGPPGTGKTLLARAVAGEADATFLSISGSDFVEMYVGVGASRVRDLFDNAKKNIPSIVFIDEIDAVGRQRGAGMGGGHDEREQTLNQLLVEMDGFGENAGVIIMAATNRPDILDPALLRPGRFDRQVTVNYPDVNGREAILKVHARNKPIGPDVRLDEIARATSGFTGADLENLLNEAALLAARRGKRALTKSEIEEATIKVVVGTEKKSKKISDDEKKLTAYHEAGHAVTNFYLSTLDPVHQVSIIPRGMAGGYTMSLPRDDKSYVSKKQMLDELVSLLGGRVAEAIILGDISTGASNDIERATKIARNMIIKYGMSEKLGPISYGSGNDEVFIGRDYGHVKNYSEETAAVIDKEVEDLIMQAYERASEILRLHIDKLHQLANYLIENEKIDGPTFYKLMEGTLGNDDDPEDDGPKGPAPKDPTPDDKESVLGFKLDELETMKPPVEEPIFVPAPEITEEPKEEIEEPKEVVEEPKVEETLASKSDFIDSPESENIEEPLFATFETTEDDINPDVMAVKSTTDSFEEFADKLEVGSLEPDVPSASVDALQPPAVELSPEELAFKAQFEQDLAAATVFSELFSSQTYSDEVYAPDSTTVIEKAEEVPEEPEVVEEPEIIEVVIAEPEVIEEPEEIEIEITPEPIEIEASIEDEELPTELLELPKEIDEVDEYALAEIDVEDDEASIDDYLKDEEEETTLKPKAKKAKLKAKVKTEKKSEKKTEEKVEEIAEEAESLTENDEIFALYELLKETRDFEEEDK